MFAKKIILKCNSNTFPRFSMETIDWSCDKLFPNSSTVQHLKHSSAILPIMNTNHNSLIGMIFVYWIWFSIGSIFPIFIISLFLILSVRVTFFYLSEYSYFRRCNSGFLFRNQDSLTYIINIGRNKVPYILILVFWMTYFTGKLHYVKLPICMWLYVIIHINPWYFMLWVVLHFYLFMVIWSVTICTIIAKSKLHENTGERKFKRGIKQGDLNFSRWD